MKNFDAIISIAIENQLPLMEASDTNIEWTPIEVSSDTEDGMTLILCKNNSTNELELLRQDHLYIHLY